MKTEYTNRYRDVITFEKKDDIIEMTGFGEHYRVGGWPEEKDFLTKFSMIDPSGGPFITAQAEWHAEEISGADMGSFLPEWAGLKIEYITVEDKLAKLHLCS
jgi:hypothetical protein